MRKIAHFFKETVFDFLVASLFILVMLPFIIISIICIEMLEIWKSIASKLRNDPKINLSEIVKYPEMSKDGSASVDAINHVYFENAKTYFDNLVSAIAERSNSKSCPLEIEESEWTPSDYAENRNIELSTQSALR